MYHFIMGERQHEVFCKTIEQPKGELIMMETSMDRISLHIAQHVMHPAHIPLHAEAQTTQPAGACHLRPGCRFFCDDHRAGIFNMGQMIKFTEKVDGFKVFSAAVFIWQPFTFLSGIVQIKHGSYGIYPQSVNVKFVQPE